MKKICFCVNNSWPGVATFLSSIRTVLKEAFPNIIVKSVAIEEKLSFNVVHAIKTEGFDLVFLGGWNDHVRTIIQNMNHAKTKVALQWCSPLTQTDMSAEIPRFMDALSFAEKGLIDYFCLLMENDVKVLSKHNDKFTFMPVCMDTSELNSIEADIFTGKHCDLFCGPCPRKNLIAQMVALSSIPDLYVHTNIPQHPNNLMYENFSQKIIGTNVVSHKWLSRPNYLKLCKSMTFGMQVSLSESFNYVGAEHMYLGVPVLMSNASPMAQGLPEELIVENPNDVLEIAEKAGRLMDDYYRAEASCICKSHIENYNNNSKKSLIATL